MEIGREQPGCLHELIGNDHSEGFRGQQANENEDLRGAGLDRRPAAQQHSDKGPWQRDQTYGPRLVQRRHQSFWQSTLNHLTDCHRAG